MKKGHLIFILILILFITIILSVLGMTFGKSEIEQQQGLANIYDVAQKV